MGTRSLIAKQTGPDTYRAVFCQLDGHLERNGHILLSTFKVMGQCRVRLQGRMQEIQVPQSEEPIHLLRGVEVLQQHGTLAFQMTI